MTDQKTTGVFVRLPNDAADPQWAKAYDAVVGDEGTKKAALWDFIQIAKAIGTPIMGGELEVVGYSYESDDTGSLVRQSDALAKLAEKDAEIARYRDSLIEAKTFHEEQDKSLSKQPPSSQGSWRRNLHQEQIEQIEEALKGPEA